MHATRGAAAYAPKNGVPAMSLRRRLRLGFFAQLTIHRLGNKLTRAFAAKPRLRRRHACAPFFELTQRAGRTAPRIACMRARRERDLAKGMP
jgi:hypothetical protein